MMLKTALLILSSTLVFAVPPAPGISSKGMPKDSVKKLQSAADLRALGYSPAQIQRALSNALGVKKLAVIFVNFSDTKFSEAGGSGGSIASYVSPATTDRVKITTQAGMLKDMIDYIAEVSDGKMTLEVTPYTTGGTGCTLLTTEAYYGNSGEANVVNGELFKNTFALGSSLSTVTSSNFDALMVVHAGVGEESSGVSGNVWSVFVEWETMYGTANGFKEAETVPGKETGVYSPFGVLCHEFGHQIGLPDLYQTVSPNDSRVGVWDLMDSGAWLNKGANPPHFSSWCKALISWITPTVQSNSGTITLKAVENASGNCFKVPILGSTTEYFLFEYRRKTGFDSQLPGQGVLIWHINDAVGSIANNTVNNGAVLRVALEEKDKDNNVSISPRGEATDTFEAAGDIFTTPQSDSYADGASKITLSDFAGSGTASMTAKLFSIPATPNIAFNKLLNYPNPVKSAASSTIRAIFSRNVTSASLRLFTVAGELILETALVQNEALSTANNEWIYDYNWNLNNAEGNAVGSGVYIYVISAKVNTQTETKTGKLAIIR